MNNEASSSKQENKSDEEEDDSNKQIEENVVDYKDLIIGNAFDEIGNSQRDTRSIAIVTVTRPDNIEFTKLIQVATEEPSDNGPLLDLHVSLFGADMHQDNNNNTHQEEFEEMIQSIEKSLERLECFKTESEAFLRNHMNTMESLNLYNSYSIPRNLSFPNLCSILNEDETKLYEEPESISSGSSLSLSSNGSNTQIRRDGPARRKVYSRNTQSMYASNTESRDPFDQRQKDIMILVSSLKKDLGTFKVGLTKSEELVNDVQIDMKDTRNCMETYIKDIPESHYSALKKLEVDIESILSKRTKNPWLDTGYAILSYLLTMFALVVWIVIYILKWGKKVIMFPRKLWRVYSEYLVERNKVVKEASMKSVSGTGTMTEENNGISVSSSVTGIHSDTMYQRPKKEI
ncbi:hypothetical protein BD770DRAFT_44454 [Pilaira anomala]|nr:hypothetical protein BD770DRAFT_44454 [Pilaira anomala]